MVRRARTARRTQALAAATTSPIPASRRAGGSDARLALRRHPEDILGDADIWEDTMDLDLTGKTALVTGSTAGIGRAIAAGLARQGATVWVNGRTAARVDAAIAAIRKDQPNAKLQGVAADGE